MVFSLHGDSNSSNEWGVLSAYQIQQGNCSPETTNPPLFRYFLPRFWGFWGTGYGKSTLESPINPVYHYVGDVALSVSSREAQICILFQKSGCLTWKNRAHFCAGDEKRWPLTNSKAANLLQHGTGRNDDDIYRGIAVLRRQNNQPFVPSATQRSPTFSQETTTFSEKNTDLCLPSF